MHKHFAFFKFKFLQQLQFRTEIVLWIVLDLIPFGVLFIIMKTIYQQAELIHTYKVTDIIFYYFAVVFIQALTSTHFEGWRVEEIKNGKIDGYLLRPFSYLKEIVFSDLAAKTFSLLIFIPIYLVFYFLTQSTVAFAIPSLSLIQVLLLIVFLLFAYFVEMAIGLIIVLFGFWFEGSQGLEHFKWITFTLMSGSMIPVEFLPPWLAQLAQALPLKYMYTVPINMIQGRSVPVATDFLFMSLSVIVISGTVLTIWKKAVFTYTSSGG